MEKRTVTFVVPCYNEATVIPEFVRRIQLLERDLRGYSVECLFVNDGSVDETANLLNSLAESDPRMKVLHFARNQGHQAALTAGMDFAAGEVIITIDADLQDPPELAVEMLKRIDEGYQVVHAQRRSRAGETGFKRFTAWSFYKIMRRMAKGDIIENSGDYRAFTRPVLQTVRSFRERHRFLRGIFATIGFRQCVVPYDRDGRFAGSSKYTLRKMISLAVNGMLSFSSAPLRMISWLSILLWTMSLGYLAAALMAHYVYHETVPGWTSLVILLTFFTGIILFCLGIIGSYVGRIFEQGQGRPLYWLSDVRNIEARHDGAVPQEVRLSDALVAGKESHGQ